VLQVLGGPQALGDDGHRCREGVLDLVVQFLEQQPLQALENALFGGVDAGLGEETAEVDVLDLEPQLIFGSHTHSADETFTASTEGALLSG
jgi:hypothetical protein